MEKEFLSSYRTFIIMIFVVAITAGIMFISYKNNDVNYLDRALFFFSAMSVFILTRNLIKSIKLNNAAIGLQIEASQDKVETPVIKDVVRTFEDKGSIK